MIKEKIKKKNMPSNIIFIKLVYNVEMFVTEVNVGEFEL